jgi:DNA-binding response OmpR family regulator/nitrogen-specific signal transduction histidine kinase
LRLNRTHAIIATKEKEHEEFINKMNMSFFSNISHEFRTPLSVIKAPINLLAKSSSLKPNEKSIIELVQRSIKRMLRLVNQLMDLSKIEADALQLKVIRADLPHQIKRILEVFEFPAKEKNITLRYSGFEESFFMFIDVDKIEKILANLLSNALKFTPESGEISVSVNIITAKTASSQFSNLNKKYEDYYALIEVSDTGIGIPEDKLEAIFQRYYQIGDQKNATVNWGTGIGLYYTKRLLNLHHGEIMATNNIKSGSTFSFVIPVAKNAYSDSELLEFIDNIKKEENIVDIKPATTIEPEIAQFNNRETILVVDDDVDIAYFLKNLLKTSYNVLTKYDGESALKSLDTITPSLIISDVLMPGITGYDLCKQIKTNINYCHIPVILLTAKSLLEEQIEGLEVGANAYVTKPFEPEYIQSMVKSQLENRKLLSQIITSQTNTLCVDENVLSPKDKAFLSQLYELLEKELSNSEINISLITQKMKMSRTNFYNKTKALTGDKPNTFFKQYKLNRAAEMLLTGEYNISEVADMTGFSTLSHFSTSFKKQFNCKPSEYTGI